MRGRLWNLQPKRRHRHDALMVSRGTCSVAYAICAGMPRSLTREIPPRAAIVEGVGGSLAFGSGGGPIGISVGLRGDGAGTGRRPAAMCLSSCFEGYGSRRFPGSMAPSTAAEGRPRSHRDRARRMFH
jgi:hypothetical protein